MKSKNLPLNDWRFVFGKDISWFIFKVAFCLIQKSYNNLDNEAEYQLFLYIQNFKTEKNEMSNLKNQ